MPDSTEGRRPRAKSPATENLLRKVEQGSVPHISRLATFFWPEDTDDGALALGIIFRLLDGEVTPTRSRLGHPAPGSSEMKERLKRISNSMNVVLTAFNHVKKIPASKDRFAQIVEGNIPVLVRWLAFLVRESSWVYSGQENAESEGVLVATDAILGIYGEQTSTMTQIEAFEAHKDSIQLVLSLYTWTALDGTTLPNLLLGSCPISALLLPLCRRDPPREHLRSVFMDCTPGRRRLFIESAYTRLEGAVSRACNGGSGKWPAIAHQALATIRMVQGFCDIPSFAREYIKTKFAARALSIAKTIPELHLPRDRNPESDSPFPVGVSIQFFPNDPGLTAPYLLHHVTEDLVSVGLLELFVDHLLSQDEDTPHPWYYWSDTSPTGHPLQILTGLTVHRPIRRAVVDAIAALPRSKLNLLEDGWRSTHWLPFRNDVRLYDSVWERQLSTRHRIELCDNLNHKNRRINEGGRDALHEPKECSHCRTAVYCSRECQREDWEKYHKEECSRQRVYRMDREQESAWVSHRDRTFFLGLLAQFLCNYESGVSIETVAGRPEGHDKLVFQHPPGWVLCERHLGPMTDKIVQFNTLASPPSATPTPLETFLALSHDGVPTYRDPRYAAMFEEYGRSGLGESGGGVRLASCSAISGIYRIYVTGRFLVAKDVRSTTVRVLNGYVKIEERKKMEVGGVRIPYEV
ncbi:hypothetical protein DFP72DRAFT_243270 [Ephemerocybe angulata]|uniref:MYND-type domain-containing protein n=1 Tax=Ephemerocybe angulata TaxID=980116 RepID=A0A8H6H9F3_9AGAR|nr:hypothetical protein DFP72DRAFT_243270 [Tulosesus angulatus]